MSNEQRDYAIDAAMDTYAGKSRQGVVRPWMEAAIEAYEAMLEVTDAEVEAATDVLEALDGMDLKEVARGALIAARHVRMEES